MRQPSNLENRHSAMNAREHAHRVHFIIKQFLWCIYSHSLDIIPPEKHKMDTCDRCVRDNNGRIRLPVSTASRTYELSGQTHVTPLRT